MSFPPSHRARRRHIPQEDEFIPADGRESRVVGRDGEVEDLVAVRAGVFLDEIPFLGVEEADAAVGGAGEEVLRAGGGVGEGVHLACEGGG